jgi:hypothetical protein
VVDDGIVDDGTVLVMVVELVVLVADVCKVVEGNTLGAWRLINSCARLSISLAACSRAYAFWAAASANALSSL